ncbi:MAG: SMI1/KNR4 family protein [Chloroflexota bacterium]
MQLDQLKALLPVPASPIEVPTQDRWLLAEKMIGVNLPDDYKAYVTTYGSGFIGDYLHIYVPFSKHSYNNLLREMDSVLYLDDNPDIPHSYFSAETKRGLLPVGTTIDGDNIFWVVGGDPNSRTIYINYRDFEYEAHDCGVVEFLVRFLSKKLNSDLIRISEVNRKRLFRNQMEGGF